MCCIFIFHELAKLIYCIIMVVLKRKHKMRPKILVRNFLGQFLVLCDLEMLINPLASQFSNLQNGAIGQLLFYEN